MRSDSLYSSHTDAWYDIWQKNRIDFQPEGDLSNSLALASAVYGALYYLTSSLALTQQQYLPFWGLSPGCLANGGEGTVRITHVHLEYARSLTHTGIS